MKAETDNLTGIWMITSRKLSACTSQREQQNHDCQQHIIEAADLDPITKNEPPKTIWDNSAQLDSNWHHSTLYILKCVLQILAIWQWQSGNGNGYNLAQFGSIWLNLAPCSLVSLKWASLAHNWSCVSDSYCLCTKMCSVAPFGWI